MNVTSGSFKWPFIISLFFGACILSAVNNKSPHHTILKHEYQTTHSRIASLAEASIAEHSVRVGKFHRHSNLDFMDRCTKRSFLNPNGSNLAKIACRN